MIPQHWYEERAALWAKQHEQIETLERGGSVPVADFVTIEVLRALEAQPITPEELAQLGDGRGQYRLGDTRAFVIAEEERCANYNSWMVREADGTTRYVSERP